MIIARMQYPDSQPPKEPWEPPSSYIAPEEARIILPTYNFINTHLSSSLPKMGPTDIILTSKDNNWCLSDGEDNYLVFALEGGRIDLDLTDAPEAPFTATWFDPRKGTLNPAGNNRIIGGRKMSLEAPDGECWVLWLER